MSQLQVTGEAKIRDIQGPVVANSGVVTALDGAASQYVRGDGTLADFPTSSGGGSSVSYYLNSSVSQGTIGGVAYRELSKDPVIGAGTDIAISTNGYVASYITDANDPDVVIVPGGNFNCEFYFSVNNNSGNPTTYAELYKYDGTTFTLLGTSAGVPESINQGTVINPYYFAIPVATVALALTDRLAIRIYVNVDGRTVTLHTENGHLCQVVTTLSKGMVSLNNLTDQSQFLTTGTAGTNFAIVSSGDTHTFNLPVASATNTGKLSSTDWSTFNNKQAALSFTAPLVNTSNTISIPVATSIVDGYLDNLDWSNFNTAYNNMIVSAAVTGTTTKTLTLTQQDAGTITASWTDDNTDAVTSVFGRTGAVVATSGDYTTTQVTEGTNLYFTDSRARSSISLTTTGTSGVATYNNTTGVFNIPNYTTDLSGYLPLTGGTLTGALNGTSASFTGNITSNLSLLINRFSNGDYLALKIENRPITNGNNGSGFIAFYSNSGDATSNTYTTGKIYGKFDTNSYNSARLTLATVTGNEIYQDVLTVKDTKVGIGTINPAQTLHLFTTSGTGSGVGTAIQIESAGTGADEAWVGVNKGTGNGLTFSVETNNIIFNTGASTPFGGTERMRITNGGDVGIGIISPLYKLDVNGTGNFSGALTGTSATFSSTVTANSLIKTGGTSAQILAADGSVITAGTNITISGGTISTSGGSITGSGTTNYVTKFTGASSIGNSLIFDNGTNVGIGQSSPSYKLDVQDNGVSGIVDVASFSVTGNGGSGRGVGILIGAAGSSNSVQVARLVGYQELANPVAVAASFAIQVANASGTLTERLRITQAGNLLIGSTTDNGSRLQVTGAATLTGALSGTSATFNDIITNTSGGYRTSASQGYILRNDANNASLGGFVRRSHWAGGAALDTQIFAETGYGIFLNVNGSVTSGLSIASTGAATFSSSVAARSGLTGTITAITTNDASGYGVGLGYVSGGYGYVTSQSASSPLVLAIDGGEKMRISTGGSIGIGTSSPDNYYSTKLVVAVGDENGITIAGTGDNFLMFADGQTGLDRYRGFIHYSHDSNFLAFGSDATERMRISSAGVVTIANLAGTGSRAVLADASGVLSAPVSDISVKQNITAIGYGLKEISKMNPVWFDFIDEYKNYGEGRQNGNIAQEMAEIIPEAVFTTPSTGKMGINYDQLHAVYIKAIQELKAEIEELKELIKNK